MNFVLGGARFPGEFGGLVPPPLLARKSGGHCTHPTGGPSFALNIKKLMRPRRPKQYCLQLDIALWCKNQIEHSI